MDNILCWNVRGLNGLNKKEDISLVLNKHNVGLVGLLETKVKPHNINRVANASQGWQSYSNTQPGVKDRIWVLWKPNRYTVQIKRTTEQVIHCEIAQTSTQKHFHITFVYGYNRVEQRRPLWLTLREISQQTTGRWMVTGDFNAVLHMQDRLGGDEVQDSEVREYAECIEHCELTEMRTLVATTHGQTRAVMKKGYGQGLIGLSRI